MRGSNWWSCLGPILILGTVACAADITQSLSHAQQSLDQQQFSTAITILEKALPQARGDERLLSLLSRAYRGEIPRLLKAGDRTTAQRYTDRLRLIELESRRENPNETGNQPSRQKTENVRVVIPDQSSLPTGSVQQSGWRPVRKSADGDDRAASEIQQLATNDNASRDLSAPPSSAAETVAGQESKVGIVNKSASVEQAKRLVSQADALFVARRYAEAGELYERADRAAPESLAAARDRWVYCRLARAVNEINTTPPNPTRWAAIKGEIQSILEKVPGNAFAQSLLSVADRNSGPAADIVREPIVRASEPDKSDAQGINLLAGLAARIGLGANASGKLPIGRRFRSGSWQVLETSSFRVHATDDQLAGRVADVAESTRIELYKTWYGKVPASNWSPKCDIFIHDSSEQYARITRQGPGSPGHSQTGVEQNRVSSRRIDLRRDGNDLVNAILPHEITHVVLADRFSARPMPRWADEGMAVLTEPPDKKHAHLKNLGDLLNRQRVFTARQLMTMNDYPNGSQWPMFYAQSVSLVEFLVNRSGPTKFVEFMEASLKNGYESELKRVYNVSSFDELDRAWSSGRLEQIAMAGESVVNR